MTWYSHDALGSVRQTLDSTGTPLGAASYDPWGTPQGGAIAPFGFTGELQDSTGLTYLRARWYTPGAGTFSAARWRTYESSPLVPLSNHVYVYALDNPVNWTDPTGKYSSSLIEAMIQRHYEARYTIGLFQAEYPIYLSSKQHLSLDPSTGRLEGTVPDLLNIGKIDIMDLHRGLGYVYEIKNARDQELGSLEIERYISIYAALPPPKSPRDVPLPPRSLLLGTNFPAERWETIGVNPFFGGATIYARLGEPGVIVWKSVNNRVPFPVVVPASERVNYRERRRQSVLRPGYATGACVILLLPGMLPFTPFGGSGGDDGSNDTSNPEDRFG
jgi:RHS repeat-associated protein